MKKEIYFLVKKHVEAIGADPELFLRRELTPVSAIGLIGGTKHHPARMSKPGFFILEDNVAVEFNIPPAKQVKDFADSIEWAISEIRTRVGDRGLLLDIAPCRMFPASELDNPVAQMFGCAPDYNAWTGKQNEKPTAQSPLLRAAGGHIHVSWPEPTVIEKRKLIQAMDLFLGIPSIMMDLDWQRRELYGKAGAYRSTSYGAEYRTLSNFWIKSRELSEWAYNQTIRAFNWVQEPESMRTLFALRDKLNTIINNGLHGEAEHLIKEYELVCV